MHLIDLPDHIASRLDELPLSARGRSFERAINKALDDAGWPGYAVAHPSYWYVNIWNRHGDLAGHVGPIAFASKAEGIAKSWQQTGAIASASRVGLGQPLTNPHAP